MDTAEAVRTLRADPATAGLVEDAYLDCDTAAAAARFSASAEFAAVVALAGRPLPGADVVDLGAGTGIASFAFAARGARVVAVDPDPGDEVGLGALDRLPATGGAVRPVVATGECLPLAAASADVVYCRQVLHHTRDLGLVMREVARVLRPGGVLVVCREHVADDEAQLAAFLAAHPVHRLAGGEHAWPLPVYAGAIEAAGLELARVLGPWDSVVNAFPAVRSDEELARYPAALLRDRLGAAGALAARLPGVTALVRRRLDRPVPGRLYSFVAHRP